MTVKEMRPAPATGRAFYRNDFLAKALGRTGSALGTPLHPPARPGQVGHCCRVMAWQPVRTAPIVLAGVFAPADHQVVSAGDHIDPLGQLGRMDRLADSITLLRGYGAQLWVFVQDLFQLKAVYPRWQSFLANTSQQFFGTADYDTARYLSGALGQQTIRFETGGSSYSDQGIGKPASTSSSLGEHFQGRSLLTPDEIMRLGPPKPLILIAGEPPYLLEPGQLSHRPCLCRTVRSKPDAHTSGGGVRIREGQRGSGLSRRTEKPLVVPEAGGIARPSCNSSVTAGGVPLFGVRAGLLEPGGGRVTRDGAAVVERGGTSERRNGSRQAQGGKSGKDQVLHRNSPSVVGRNVRLRWMGRWTSAGWMIILHCGIGFMRLAGKSDVDPHMHWYHILVAALVDAPGISIPAMHPR